MKYSNSDFSKQIVLARQSLVMDGHLEQGLVAEAIERSWRRCIANGIDANSGVSNEVVTRQDLARRVDKNHLLLSHAEPEMATLNEQIAHTRSMVILTDSEGVILHSMGDHQFLNEAQRVSLSPGCSWHEDHRGTNAIGTALFEKTAITVQGAEHFIERHHILSCSAVPIFGSMNQLIGTLDVSNDLLLPQQHTLALVKMAAQMIENRLFNASHDYAYALHFHARPEFIGTLWEGIALFSEDGRLVAMNRSGQFQLGLNINSESININNLFDISINKIISLSEQQNLFSIRVLNGALMHGRLSQRFNHQSYLAPSSPSNIPHSPSASRNSAASLDMLNCGDPKVKHAISQAKLLINQDIPMLIEGETGAGKELFARAIHDASQRANGPWIAVNCAALPEGLIEAELFGYEEGAFTGAKRKGSIGKLEQANGGTLFLDEIGDMPLSLQARLLRVLQERSVTPLGGGEAKPLTFALLSATNQKLKDKVKSGEFRSDLYYRLNGITLSLPPLRLRTDLPALIDMLMQVEQVSQLEISDSVMAIFEAHPWPGNIRQLHNVLRTAIALADGNKIEEMHLTQDFLDEMEFDQDSAESAQGALLSLDHLTIDAIRKTMQSETGNVSAAARRLGISRNTLYRKLKTLGLA